MKAIAPQEFKLVHRYTEHKSLKWHKQRDKQKVRDRKTWDIMALLTPDTDMHLMVLFQDRSFFMLITNFLFTCASNAPPWDFEGLRFLTVSHYKCSVVMCIWPPLITDCDCITWDGYEYQVYMEPDMETTEKRAI